MPKPQEYADTYLHYNLKVVFSWPTRSSKYVNLSSNTLYHMTQLHTFLRLFGLPPEPDLDCQTPLQNLLLFLKTFKYNDFCLFKVLLLSFFRFEGHKQQVSQQPNRIVIAKCSRKHLSNQFSTIWFKVYEQLIGFCAHYKQNTSTLCGNWFETTTVVLILVDMSYFQLQTGIIIKIQSHPCYPIKFD